MNFVILKLFLKKGLPDGIEHRGFVGEDGEDACGTVGMGGSRKKRDSFPTKLVRWRVQQDV